MHFLILCYLFFITIQISHIFISQYSKLTDNKQKLIQNRSRSVNYQIQSNQQNYYAFINKLKERTMAQSRLKSLYLPILTNIRNEQTNHIKKDYSYSHNKNQINDILKMIQLKKAQLERKNHENQQSDSQSDEEQQQQFNQNRQQNVSINQRYKVLPLQNNKLFNINERPKVKTHIGQDNQREQNTTSLIKNRHFRIRTQHNQNSSKTPPNSTKTGQHKLRKVQTNMPLIKYLKPSQMSQQLSQIIAQIPKKSKDRNQITLKRLIVFLQQYNPFFMKLDRVVSTCLLKICNIVKKQKRDLVYEKQKGYQKFYVILSGKVKLINKDIDLKKICVPGQTILEQVYLGSNQNKNQVESYQKAKSIGTTYILEITLEKLRKIKQQLTKFGFKIHYNELQALIKRNYIVKNALRIQKNKF